jgi:hypothetical protein
MRISLIAAWAVFLFSCAAPASGAEVVGSDLSGTVDAVPFLEGHTQTGLQQRTGTALPMAATARGVIVEVRVKHSAVTSDALSTFSILSGISPNFSARPPEPLSGITWVNGQPAGIRTVTPLPDAQGRPRGVPILAGERLAFRSPPGSGTPPNIEDDDAPGAQVMNIALNHSAGGPFVYGGPFSSEQLLQMRIEPDVDGDGYGDETQDRCTTVAGPAPCPASPPPPAAASAICAGLVATHVGTEGAETIVGTSGRDVVAALGGNDTVIGLGGKDVICGGAGNDTLKGGQGTDKCVGGPGKDKAKKCEKLRTVP